MGMELTSHWICDRCNHLDIVGLNEVPVGWSGTITPTGLTVDAEDHMPDIKMGFTKKIICDKCTRAYIEWLGLPVEEEKPAPAPTPEPAPPVVTEAPEPEIDLESLEADVQ